MQDKDYGPAIAKNYRSFFLKILSLPINIKPLIATTIIIILVFGTVFVNNLAPKSSALLSILNGNFSPPKLNLILISIDTLRADRLGVYGYSRPTSPAIDRFADDATVFMNSVATSSWTLPSHISMFTGYFPSAVGVVRKDDRLSNNVKTVTQLLKSAGYKSAAFAGGGYVSRRFGFDRGFESFNTHEHRPYKNLTGFAASILKAKEFISGLSGEEPFFLFLHTYDVHCPYQPKGPYYSMFKSPNARSTETNKCGAYLNSHALSKKEVLYISDRYDGSIREIDDQFGHFIDHLRAENLLDKSVIIVTSDHGEEFLEHARVGHQNSLYRELIQIPLIIRVPGANASTQLGLASLVDIPITILQLLGISEVHPGDGRSLVPDIYGDSSNAPPALFSELDRGRQLRSLFSIDHHYIIDLKNSNKYLFDLSNDRSETKNIAALQHELAETMHADLIKTEERILHRSQPISAQSSKEQAAEPSSEQIERLKTLGYL